MEIMRWGQWARARSASFMTRPRGGKSILREPGFLLEVEAMGAGYYRGRTRARIERRAFAVVRNEILHPIRFDTRRRRLSGNPTLLVLSKKTIRLNREPRLREAQWEVN